MSNKWKMVKLNGKHGGWRYCDGERQIGYVVKNLADCPSGKPFRAGFYPQPHRFGHGIGWYRTVADAKQAVEDHVAGPAARLLSLT